MIKEITIKIEGVDYKVKKTNRAVMLFEDMTGKPFSKIDDTMKDLLTVFYCILKVNNSNFTYEFDAFIDVLDTDDKIVVDFVEYVTTLASDNVQPDAKKSKKK